MDTIRQHIEVWACLDAMKDLVKPLLIAHQYWKGQGVQIAELLRLLIEVDDSRLLEASVREQLFADRSSYSNVRSIYFWLLSLFTLL